ncbi:hypothetical protein AA313_de0203271 [Arthrobotrys entomopaga]|nr:hypothetical protein AA313_de0203271 [Arthrobotrys entomopaga]
MGRYLPWRDGPGEFRPLKRIKTEPDEDAIAKRKKEKEEKDDDFREDEYMRDGLDHDDKYIMVEDELLQIAKSYTARLHSAELTRLQDQLARRKAQRASQSQSPSQPKITGSMSKHRQVVLQRRAHDTAVQKAAGVKPTPREEEQYNTKFSSRSLGRLMTTSAPRIESTLPLPPFPGKSIKPATRAAAGFTKASFKKPSSSQTSPSELRRMNSQVARDNYGDDDDDSDDEEDDDVEETDDSDDDLDAVPKRRSTFPRERKPPIVEKRTGFKDADGRISSSKHPPVSSSLATNIVDKPIRPSSIKRSPSSLVSKPPVKTSSIPPKPPTASTPKAQKQTLGSTLSKSKPKLALSDSDSDDYADAAQAERFRRRKQLAEAQKSGAKS